MDNAHRDHIKNLYRWWNGHVFSFENSGKEGKNDGGQDSGMDEAEAALNSDEELSGVVSNTEEFGDGIEDWHRFQDGHPARSLQNNCSADVSADFMRLTISDRQAAARVHAVASSRRYTVAPRVREPNFTLSESPGTHDLSALAFLTQRD